MHLPLSRTLLLVAGACLLLIGCERTSESKVRDEVSRSHELALIGTDQSVAEARQILEGLDLANASLASRANARALLAQIELDAARTAQRDMDRHLMELSQLVAQVVQLGNQIATSNALVEGYRTYDPREAQAAIEQKIADAQGGPDKPAWFSHENGQLPTLAVLRQRISENEGKLAALQEQLAQLDAQRKQVLTESNQLAQQSEGQQSQQSLEAFKRGSALRKQAADLATEMSRVEAAITPLEQDLQIARAQAQIIEGMIAELREQSRALQAGWEAIQQQMSAQTQIARAVLEGAPDPGATQLSIAALATQINALLSDLDEKRDLALDNARNAISHFGEAVGASDELRRDIGPKIDDQRMVSRPEQKGWRLLRDVMQPAAFRLNQALAQKTLAQIHAADVRQMRTRVELRNALTPILQASGLMLPDALQAPNLERQLEQAVTSANEAFTEADDSLESVTEGQAPQQVQGAAYAARILTLYAWSQFSRESGDAKSAQEQLEMAQQVRRAALERDLTLPTMPAGLGEAPKPPAPEPEAAADESDDAQPAGMPDASETQEPAPDSPAPQDTPTEPAGDEPQG